MKCDRCNVEMTLGTMYEGSTLAAWYCPCCKAKLRTPEMKNAEDARDAAEAGVSLETYQTQRLAHSIVRVAPPSEAEIEHVRDYVAKAAAEWEPTCEHVTNPVATARRCLT